MPHDAHPRLHVAAVAQIPLGGEMAHAINAFKTAGGFERLGHRVTLLCPPPAGGDVPAALAGYGETALDVRLIHPVAGDTEEEAARRFARAAADLAAELGCDCIYGRNFHIGLEGPCRGIPTAIETHAHVGDPRPLLDEVFAATRDPLHPLDAIITIAPALRDHYISRGADPARVYLVPDAADPGLFAPPPEWESPARRSRPMALYSGHLYDYKGIPTILKAASLAPDIDWAMLGGAPSDTDRVRAQARHISNVHVLGRVDHAQVPVRLWEADVLLLPPAADHPSAQWTSPVKLAEYLWAGRPVAASRIPGLQNWVDEPAVSWFPPDDAEAMVHCVRRLLAETRQDALKRRSAQARFAEQYTYANRAGRMLGALSIPARV